MVYITGEGLKTLDVENPADGTVVAGRANPDLARRLNVDLPAATREALADCVEESERVLNMLNVLMDVTEAEADSMMAEYETGATSTCPRCGLQSEPWAGMWYCGCGAAAMREAVENG